MEGSPIYPGLDVPVIVAVLAGLGVGALCGARQRQPDRGLPDPAVHRDPGHADHRPRRWRYIYTNGRPVSTLDPEFLFIGGGALLGIPFPIILFDRRHPAHAPDAQRHALRAPGLRDRRQRDSGPGLGHEHRPDEDPDLHLLGPPGGPRRRRAHRPRSVRRHPRWASATSSTRSPPRSSAAPASPAASARSGAAVVGALIIGVMNNGLDLLNVSPFYQQVVKGVIIIVAIIIDERKNR